MTVRTEADQGTMLLDKAIGADAKPAEIARAAAQTAPKIASSKRASPDPTADTDRYRLATPYLFKL